MTTSIDGIQEVPALRGVTVLSRTLQGEEEGGLLGGLNSLGMSIVQRASDQAMLQTLQTQPVRMVLLDLTSPWFRDLELAFRLRELPRRPIMVGLGRPEDYKFSMALGAAAFLPMPIHLDEAAERLVAALSGQRFESCHFDPETCSALQIQALRRRLREVQTDADRSRAEMAMGRSVKNDVMHAISTEFINPLSPVKLYLQMVERGMLRIQSQAAQQEALDLARQGVLRINSLIDSIRDFAALDLTKPDILRIVPFAVKDELTALKDKVLFAQAKPKHVELKINFNGEVPASIQTDREAFLKIANAMMSHAVRRSAPGTQVYVDVTSSPGAAALSVSVFDQGKTPDGETILQMTDLYRARSGFEPLSIADLLPPTAKRLAGQLGGKLEFLVPPMPQPLGMSAVNFGFCQSFTLAPPSTKQDGGQA